MKNLWLFLLQLSVIGFCMNVQSQSLPLVTPPQSSSFSLKTLQIQGNTLLPESKLMALVAHLVGNGRTLNDLVQGATAVQQAYREAGYGGVVAFVPEQKLEDGNAIIQVIEGKIDKVLISGHDERDETNILRSLPHLKQGETPVVRNIDRNIQMANENPTKKMRVVLVAGASPGAINADAKVTDERPLRLLFGVDSAGTPGTGNFRTNVGIQHTNLWNRDHIGTFQFQTSPTEPSRAQIYSAGYRIPFYNQFAAIDAFYAHSNVESVASAVQAGPFGFTGKGDIAGFRAHRFLPRLGEYDHRVTFGWDWRHFNNNCVSVNASGVRENASGFGACDSRITADVTITPLSLGYVGQKDGPIFSWGINTNISGNFGGSSQAVFNAARLDADKHYAVWRFFGFTNWNLPAGFGLATRVLAQYSPHALVPGEQFGIGGGGSAMGGFISVRGYREREIVGDYGASFNIEGLGPDFAKLVNSESLSLRPLGFFDFGWAGNNYHMPCDAHGTSCEIASVGGGIRFAIGKKFSGRLDFGHALMDGNQKAAGTSRGHLAINFHY